MQFLLFVKYCFSQFPYKDPSKTGIETLTVNTSALEIAYTTA